MIKVPQPSGNHYFLAGVMTIASSRGLLTAEDGLCFLHPRCSVIPCRHRQSPMANRALELCHIVLGEGKVGLSTCAEADVRGISGWNHGYYSSAVPLRVMG